MVAYPDRIRLPRGKHIHAAQTVPTITACRKRFDIDDADWFDESETVTCPKCTKEES